MVLENHIRHLRTAAKVRNDFKTIAIFVKNSSLMTFGGNYKNSFNKFSDVAKSMFIFAQIKPEYS
jgi:hypothetical protein